MSTYDRKASARKAVQTRRSRGNYGHSESTRERLRLATARHLALVGNRQVSKIEDEVAKELLRIGVSFRRQVAIRDPVTGRFCALVDFQLSDRVVIEVNGTYWHADPRFYPEGPVTTSQVRTCDRYQRKMAALRGLGVEVVELWEADLREGVQDAVANAVRAIGQGVWGVADDRVHALGGHGA